MPGIHDHAISCPYCGERFSILVDDSVAEQQYVEDCEVCCRPILLTVSVDPDGGASVIARTDSE